MLYLYDMQASYLLFNFGSSFGSFLKHVSTTTFLFRHCWLITTHRTCLYRNIIVVVVIERNRKKSLNLKSRFCHNLTIVYRSYYKNVLCFKTYPHKIWYFKNKTILTMIIFLFLNCTQFKFYLMKPGIW